jgi:hypothetical protein
MTASGDFRHAICATSFRRQTDESWNDEARQLCALCICWMNKSAKN